MPVARLHAVAELEAVGWDRLLGRGDYYLSTDWLRVLEQRVPLEPTFVTLLDGSPGRAVAGAPVYVFDDRLPGPFYRLDDVVERAAASRREEGAAQDSLRAAAERAGELLPSAGIGGRHLAHNTVLTAPDADAASRRSQIAEVLDAAEAIGAERGARTAAVLYVDEDAAELRDALERAGYRRFLAAVASVMRVRWPTFDEYQQHLGSKRRNQIRRERARLADAGIRFDVVPMDAGVRERIAPLELQLLRKYGHDDELSFLADNYRALEATLGESVKVTIAERDGALCGFGVAFQWRDELYTRQVGFDYALVERLPVYFGVAFYSLVEYAIANGIGRIDYAIESERTKELRGCDPVRQYAYVKALDPACRPVVDLVADAIGD